MTPLLKRIHTFEQSSLGWQLSGAARSILFMIGMIGLVPFWFDNNPLPERIEAKFSLILPASAYDFGWYRWSESGHVTLAKFTVALDDLEPTLESIEWNLEDCWSEDREWDYMPEFYTDDSLSWWQPFEATSFEGLSCYDYNPKGWADNYNLMVDYSVPEVATVYLEEYSVDAEGRRALWDEIEKGDGA
ncbi:MAG TPA: hypothetical protein VHO69_16485 [Phototrophicaceae bacterium]|nr:hypothetical protein [Phototrophicaceae bacterium]